MGENTLQWMLFSIACRRLSFPICDSSLCLVDFEVIDRDWARDDLGESHEEAAGAVDVSMVSFCDCLSLATHHNLLKHVKVRS